MTHNISLDSIRQHLPHVDVDNLFGRQLPLYALHDDGKWKLWIPDGRGGLCKIIASPVEAKYFSKQAAKPDDARLPFLDFFDQRCNLPQTGSFSRAAYSDIQNLAASLAKLEIIFLARNSFDGVARMAATELEYIFLICRSLFDLFQEIMAALWRQVILSDQSLKKKDLPSSYRKMVMNSNQRMTVDEIIEKYTLPARIAAAYHATSDFFEWLRAFRDSIAHSGRDFDLVYDTNRGFAISTLASPFSRMDIWDDRNTLPNNLGSLKSAACHVIHSTLSTIDAIVAELQSEIAFPPPIVPGYSVYFCGPSTKHITEVEVGVQVCAWYTIAT